VRERLVRVSLSLYQSLSITLSLSLSPLSFSLHAASAGASTAVQRLLNRVPIINTHSLCTPPGLSIFLERVSEERDEGGTERER
jgi:hypothetical protein